MLEAKRQVEEERAEVLSEGEKKGDCGSQMCLRDGEK